ncbi:Protein ALP1-like [Pseudolycoriella hygida]|uniref:Protein ALP1-like n=1 Tax=Pseudolycoriella hygida TaxID=35572 RepID=A0A9Q0N9L9_9DIPT|nr:Protein ALP1-like [Pseudolycoriella hygida]
MSELSESLIDDCADELGFLNSDQEEEMDEILDNLSHNLDIVPMFRYSYMSKVPKTLTWYEETFPDYDEKRFRQLVRCTKLQFDSILSKIRSHKNFNGRNSCKQFTVEFQLSLLLYRLGSNGDGATIQKISCLFGIGDGGTINKITERIFEAILSLEPKYLTWPNSAERNTLVEKTMHELPYLVGYTDGTEIELAEASKIDRDVYLSRNKIFALKLQTTIDYTKKVRHIVVGYPGSVHDARIFNECDLALNPRKYLTEPQRIGADSAYKLRTTLITPFRKNSKELTATALFV